MESSNIFPSYSHHIPIIFPSYSHHISLWLPINIGESRGARLWRRSWWIDAYDTPREPLNQPAWWALPKEMSENHVGSSENNVGQTMPLAPSPSHHYKLKYFLIGGINKPFPHGWCIIVLPTLHLFKCWTSKFDVVNPPEVTVTPLASCHASIPVPWKSSCWILLTQWIRMGDWMLCSFICPSLTGQICPPVNRYRYRKSRSFPGKTMAVFVFHFCISYQLLGQTKKYGGYPPTIIHFNRTWRPHFRKPPHITKFLYNHSIIHF